MPPSTAREARLQLSDLIGLTEHLTISVDVYASALEDASLDVRTELARLVDRLVRCVSMLSGRLDSPDIHSQLRLSSSLVERIRVVIREAEQALARAFGT